MGYTLQYCDKCKRADTSHNLEFDEEGKVWIHEDRDCAEVGRPIQSIANVHEVTKTLPLYLSNKLTPHTFWLEYWISLEYMIRNWSESKVKKKNYRKHKRIVKALMYDVE